MTQVKSPFFRIIRIIAKPKIIFALVAAFLAVAGFFYVKNIWDVNLSQTETAAIRTALSAEGLLSSTAVGKLTATPEDIDTAEYRQIKESLADLVAYDQNVRFAYLYTQKDGKIYFMVDSEPADSVDYSPPGQEYTDAVDATFQPFEDGLPLLTQPVTDSWGTWVSALVPVKDADTDEVIAVFGLDFPADKWYDVAFRETLLAAAVILVQVGILFSFYLVLSQKGRMKAEKEKLMLVTDKLEEEKAKLLVTSGKLRESEVLFRTIYEKSSVGIAIGSNEISVVDTNAMYEKIVGRKTDETKALGWKKYTHPDDAVCIRRLSESDGLYAGEPDQQQGCVL